MTQSLVIRSLVRSFVRLSDCNSWGRHRFSVCSIYQMINGDTVSICSEMVNGFGSRCPLFNNSSQCLIVGRRWSSIGRRLVVDYYFGGSEFLGGRFTKQPFPLLAVIIIDLLWIMRCGCHRRSFQLHANFGESLDIYSNFSSEIIRFHKSIKIQLNFILFINFHHNNNHHLINEIIQ